MERLLATYLRDHEAASAGGLDLFRRAARAQRRRPWGGALAVLRDEVEADRQSLRSILAELRVRPDPLLTRLVRTGERLGRLKPNTHVLTRSPLSDLVEIEAAVTAVRAKGCGWRALIAADVVVTTVNLSRLAERADDQEARLLRMHAEVAADVFGATSGRSTT